MVGAVADPIGAAAAAAGKVQGVLIEVNTGMNRAGTEPDSTPRMPATSAGEPSRDESVAGSAN